MSTAGRRSDLARTERSRMSVSDFAAELVRLDPGSESINAMIYGDSNVGKTALAGTCPGKTFWLIGEPGYKTAARRGAIGVGRKIPDTATAWAAVEWLEGQNTKTKKPRYESFDWIVLDGLSTMQDRFRLGYAAEAFDIDPSKRQHRNLPDRPDYFNTQNMLKAWIPRLVDMPVNFLITAHAYRTDLTDSGELLVFPGVQGKVTETANAISGLMDLTGYMELKKLRSRDGSKVREVRRLYFSSPERTSKKEDDVRYICGEKFGNLGKYMDNPTMPRLLEQIQSAA